MIMKVNLITLMSPLHAKKKELVKETKNFVDEMNTELLDEDIIIQENVKSDALIDAVFVASGGAEASFKRIYKNLSDPFVLFSSNKDNSLAACLEIKTFCQMNKKSCCFLGGGIEAVTTAMKHVCNVVFTHNKVIDTNLGVIGKPSDWLIASKVTKKEVYDNYKINLIDIKMDELYSLIDLHEIDRTHRRYKELMSKYKDTDTLNTALYIYTAIKKLIEKYNLKGLTIRCFDLLKKYQNTACLALAMLNEEGVVCACEGDIPSLITMYLIYVMTGRPTFMANPSQINLQELTVTFAHCTVPLNLVDKYELLTHFESDQGIGVKGHLSEGFVSIIKISPKLGNGRDLLISGKILENLSLPGLCRTQIKVGLDENDMYSLIKENYGNHVIITYADIIPDFYPLLNFFKNKEL